MSNTHLYFGHNSTAPSPCGPIHSPSSVPRALTPWNLTHFALQIISKLTTRPARLYPQPLRSYELFSKYPNFPELTFNYYYPVPGASAPGSRVQLIPPFIRVPTNKPARL